MAALSPEQREKTDIVFFDNEESGFIGSALFKRKHKNEPKDKLVMKFDCVSDGDYFLIIQNKKHGGNSAELWPKLLQEKEKIGSFPMPLLHGILPIRFGLTKISVLRSLKK